MFYCWWPGVTERKRKNMKGNYSSTSSREAETGSLTLSLPDTPSCSHWGISITYSLNNSSLRSTRTQTVIRRFRKVAAGTGRENICYCHTHLHTVRFDYPTSPFNSAGTFPSSGTQTHLLLFSSLSTRADGMRFNQPGPCVRQAKCQSVWWPSCKCKWPKWKNIRENRKGTNTMRFCRKEKKILQAIKQLSLKKK